MKGQSLFWRFIAYFFTGSLVCLVALISMIHFSLHSAIESERAWIIERHLIGAALLLENAPSGPEDDWRILLADYLRPLYEKGVIQSVTLHKEKPPANANQSFKVLQHGPWQGLMIVMEYANDATLGKLWSVEKKIFAMATIVLLAMALWMVISARALVNPFLQLRRMAQLLSQGGEEQIDETLFSIQEMKDVVVEMQKIKTRDAQRIGKILKQKIERDSIFASLTEGLVTINLSGIIRHLNRSAAEMFELDANKTYKGQNYQEVFHSRGLIELVEKSRAEEKMVAMEMVLPRGINLLIKSTGLYNSEGQRVGLLITMNDISELKELESYRKEFVANVSHELRTPLTSIQGYAETLMEMQIDDPDVIRFIEVIRNNSIRLKKIIDDLLQLARMERDAQGQMSSNFQVGDLRDVANQAIELVTEHAQKKQMKIIAHWEDKAYWVRMAPNLILQAMINLLENAVRYGHENTSIWLRLKNDDVTIAIEVEDQGPGIDPDHHKRLFERFYSVDKAHSKELGGSGLGLAIVKHIAQIHGAEVGIHSKKGSGSVFFVKFLNSDVS